MKELILKILYIQKNIIQPFKKKDILPFATTCIDLEGTVLIEVSHTQKGKTQDLTYMWMGKQWK